MLLILFFFLMIRRPPISTLFPSPTLFRSASCWPRSAAPPCPSSAANCWPPASAWSWPAPPTHVRSEEHTSELQSRLHLVCRLLLEKKNPVHHFPRCDVVYAAHTPGHAALR